MEIIEQCEKVKTQITRHLGFYTRKQAEINEEIEKRGVSDYMEWHGQHVYLVDYMLRELKGWNNWLDEIIEGKRKMNPEGMTAVIINEIEAYLRAAMGDQMHGSTSVQGNAKILEHRHGAGKMARIMHFALLEVEGLTFEQATVLSFVEKVTR